MPTNYKDESKRIVLEKQEYFAAFGVTRQMLSTVTVEQRERLFEDQFIHVVRCFAPKEILVDKTVTLEVQVPATWQDYKKFEELAEHERTPDAIAWKTISRSYRFEHAAVFPNAPAKVFGAFVTQEFVSPQRVIVRYPTFEEVL